MIFFQKFLRVNNKIKQTKRFNKMINKKNKKIQETLEELETKKKRDK